MCSHSTLEAEMWMKAKVSDSVVSKVGWPKTPTGVWRETARMFIDRNPLSRRRERGRRRAPEVWRGKCFIWVSPEADPETRIQM